MISESINNSVPWKRTLANRVGQNQKQKSAESDQGLHYLLKIPENGNVSINDWLS